MSTWDIIKVLFKNANFYWRKFFVFLLITVAVAGGVVLWQNQNKTEAAVLFSQTNLQTYTSEVNLDIEVRADGQILANGKDFSKYLKILPESYEIRILALDAPGVYIQNFQAQIHLPQAVRKDQIYQRIIAIHGAEQSYRSYLLDAKTLVYQVDDVPSQGQVTLIANLPKNILTPSLGKRLVYGLGQISAKSYIIVSIISPLLTLIVMIFMVVRRRQDQIFHLSQKISNVPPTNSPPAVVGVLIDGQVGAREIAATIIDLAVRGYLFITYHQNGQFTFGKRKSINLENLPELREYERILLSKIFELGHYKSTREDVDIRVGRHIFSRKIAQVYLNIYNEATALGFFVKNPVQVHLRWKYTGIALFFAGLLGFGLAAIYSPDPKFTLFFWAGEMAAASVIIWLSGLMPTRSVTGTIALRRWLEFRNYFQLNRRIEAGANVMNKFCQLLPYALVFGLESEWARRFLKDNFTRPDWYDSEDQVVTLERFVDGLYPIIEYVGGALHKSHEPTVE